jgi:hypothetical protein
MDAEAYRKDYLAQLKAREQTEPTKIAKSVKSAGQFAEEDDVARLLEVIANTKAPIAMRLQAISRINVISFDRKAFAPYHADYIRVLKQLRTDRSAEIRRSAFRGLSLSLDPDTRSMLHESLSASGKKLIPDKAAVTLLAFDDHVSSREVLRTKAEDSNEAVRLAALRGLAGDTRSAALLEKVTENSAESAKVRETAALSLKVAAPQRFAKVARKIVTDETEDRDLRAVAMSALAHGAEVRNIAQSAAFEKKLDAVAEETKSRSLKKSIKLFKALSK